MKFGQLEWNITCGTFSLKNHAKNVVEKYFQTLLQKIKIKNISRSK